LRGCWGHKWKVGRWHSAPCVGDNTILEPQASVVATDADWRAGAFGPRADQAKFHSFASFAPLREVVLHVPVSRVKNVRERGLVTWRPLARFY
jgi:hypothetical protein